MDVAKRLCERRLEFGLTIEQLADQAGVNFKTVRRLESQPKRAYMASRRKVCAALHLDPISLDPINPGEKIVKRFVDVPVSQPLREMSIAFLNKSRLTRIVDPQMLEWLAYTICTDKLHPDYIADCDNDRDETVGELYRSTKQMPDWVQELGGVQ